MPSLLITHPRLIPDGAHYEVLRDAGFEVRVPDPDDDAMDERVLTRLLVGVDAIIAGMEPLNESVVDQLPQLRVVARCGVGYDSVDVPACTARDILVTTTPGTNHHSVAEHALSMMLALSRGFPQRDLLVRSRKPWVKAPWPRFAGSTVGIVGLGRIGRTLAMRLPSLQVRIVAYEPFPDERFVAEHGIELLSLEQVFAESDYLSLHLPVTDESRGMVNRNSLATMKRGAKLINTARGGLIIEADLVDALRSGQLSAAALDVLEEEPPPNDHPLLEMENVLFSPHAAGIDEQSHHDSIMLAAQVVVDLFQGRWPDACVVNRDQRGDWRW